MNLFFFIDRNSGKSATQSNCTADISSNIRSQAAISANVRNEQHVSNTTQWATTRIPIISMTIPGLDNTSSSFLQPPPLSCTFQPPAVPPQAPKTARLAPGSPSTSKPLANDASSIIPTSVRNMLLPILSRKEGSVISIAGSSTTGKARPLLRKLSGNVSNVSLPISQCFTMLIDLFLQYFLVFCCIYLLRNIYLFPQC